MGKRRYLFILALPYLLFGCSNVMVKAPSPEVKPPPANKATIVFMRTSFVAGAIGCDLFEVNSGKLKYVGALSMGNKIAYETDPGEKVIMAYGVAADFMKANVQAGKTYYVIVRPNWGTGGFAPTPIRRDTTSEYNVNTAEFKEWLSGTDLVVRGPEADTWFKENEVRMTGIYNEYWTRFQQKTPGEIAERMLNPQDGK